MNTNSVAFDGVDGVITINDNNFDGLANGTVELWFKSSYKGAYQKLARKENCIDIGLTQDFGGGAKVFGSITGAGDLGELEEHDYADGAWHHLALSWDGSFLRGYVDGVYKKRVAQSGSQANVADHLYLGRIGWGGEPLNGNIDEFRISDTARYTTETSFTPQTTEFVDDANTLVLLHMNDGTGTNANDETGDNDGTLSGGSSWSSSVPFLSAAVQDIVGNGIIPFAR